MKSHFATTVGALCKNRHLLQGHCLSGPQTSIFCILAVLNSLISYEKVGNISLFSHSRSHFVTEVGFEGKNTYIPRVTQSPSALRLYNLSEAPVSTYVGLTSRGWTQKSVSETGIIRSSKHEFFSLCLFTHKTLIKIFTEIYWWWLPPLIH